MSVPRVFLDIADVELVVFLIDATKNTLLHGYSARKTYILLLGTKHPVYKPPQYNLGRRNDPCGYNVCLAYLERRSPFKRSINMPLLPVFRDSREHVFVVLCKDASFYSVNIFAFV